MPEKEVHSEAGEVQNSLDSIAEMERAALQRAIPSPRLGATIGLLSGALVALSVAGRQEYHLYVILVIGCVLVWESVNQRRMMGVSARHVPSIITAIELIILIPLYFLLVVGGQSLAGMLGSVAASLSAGVMLAVTVFAVSYWERRWYFTRIGVQEAA